MQCKYIALHFSAVQVFSRLFNICRNAVHLYQDSFQVRFKWKMQLIQTDICLQCICTDAVQLSTNGILPMRSAPQAGKYVVTRQQCNCLPIAVQLCPCTFCKRVHFWYSATSENFAQCKICTTGSINILKMHWLSSRFSSSSTVFLLQSTKCNFFSSTVQFGQIRQYNSYLWRNSCVSSSFLEKTEEAVHRRNKCSIICFLSTLLCLFSIFHAVRAIFQRLRLQCIFADAVQFFNKWRFPCAQCTAGSKVCCHCAFGLLHSPRRLCNYVPKVVQLCPCTFFIHSLVDKLGYSMFHCGCRMVNQM